jgi:transposase
VYAYAAVSPEDGCLDYWMAPKMNTEHMSQFLAQVRTAHPGEFILMVLDGASPHKSKDLKIPEHMVLIPLPPYSPELNPKHQTKQRSKVSPAGPGLLTV